MSEKDLTTRKETQPATGEAAKVPAVRPAVDILEDAQGISLSADLPGVSSEALDLKVDRDTLSIAAEARIDMPEGMEPLYADVRATRFERSFTLSPELDAENIKAELKQGVLRIRIPKRAELQPRKIEVRAG